MPAHSEHQDPGRPLRLDEAKALAHSMRLFGTASRLRLLWAMLDSERTVEQLVEATGIAPSAASHQLRRLRQERLVSVRRAGRHAFYRHYDHHVAELLAAIRLHHEHVRLAQPPGADAPATSSTPMETREPTGSRQRPKP